jgi:molybdate/tungstate transport system substrate-binding protein
MKTQKTLRCIAILLLTALMACSFSCAKKPETTAKTKLAIFHAGSLSVPFKEISAEFEKENPGVKILLEAAGSRTCARKISDLKRPCDIMASADYTVIDTLLIPDHADWNIKFATNEMAIVFHKASRYSDQINTNNWHEILMKKDVAFGRANPDADPCGYRSVLTMKLAENHYNQPGLAEKMIAKDTKNIRPKETDLLALLEVGEIDYLFLYRSVAQQHGLDYIELPAAVNLKDSTLAENYAKVTVDISGKTPGKTVTKKGQPMVYGVTIPKNSPNPKMAMAFMEFLLSPDKGMAIMQKNGQPGCVPSPSKSYDKIPAELKTFASPAKTD